MPWWALLVAVALASVHLWVGKLRFLNVIPRSRWLSAAGGASVAYVFVHVFPELGAHQSELSEALPLRYLEHHVYLVALIGFGIYYGLERFAQEHSGRDRREAPSAREATQERTPPGVFALHIGSFAIYNFLIGYLLLHREEAGLASLLLYGLAMLLHFVVNDFGLRQHHQKAYHRVGRWILVAAIFVGWGVGLAAALEAAAVAILFAFLAGGVILNVVKEELPSHRQSRFGAFALGATVYAALLLLVGQI